MINIPTHYNNKCMDLVKYHTDLIIIVDSDYWNNISSSSSELFILFILRIYIHTSYIIYKMSNT